MGIRSLLMCDWNESNSIAKISVFSEIPARHAGFLLFHVGVRMVFSLHPALIVNRLRMPDTIMDTISRKSAILPV